MSSEKTHTLIEVGGGWVKLVQAVSTGSGPALRHVAVGETGAEGEEAAQRLAEVVRQAGVDVGRTTVCLPRQMVTVWMMDLPSTDGAEIAGMVDLQFGKKVPYSRDEVLADYHVMGTPREGYTRVMMVVAQRAPLRELFYALEAAGVEGVRTVVSTEGVAAWAAAEGLGAGGAGAVLVLDLDAGGADLLALREGQLLFSRSLLIEADALLAGQSAAREKLVNECRRAVEVFRGESPDVDFDELILTGCGSVIDGLGTVLEDSLHVPVRVRDALGCVSAGAGSQAASAALARGISLTALVGIALGGRALGFRLLPDAVRMRRRLVERARGFILAGMLLVSLLTVASLRATAKYAVRRQRLADVRARVTATEPAVARVRRRQEIVRLMERRLDGRYSTVSLLGALHEAVPEGVVLDSIDIDREAGRLAVRGSSPTAPEVDNLMAELEASALLREVRQEGVTQRDQSQRYRFQIEAFFEDTDDGAP